MNKYLVVISFLLSLIGCSDNEHNHKDKVAPEIFSSDNEYLTNLNLMKGHLWVGVELYKENYLENAKRHMKHPKSELYEFIIPTFEAKGAPGFSDQLERLALSVENEENLAVINQDYQNLFEAIDENEKFVGKGSENINEKINLVVSLLKIAADEYSVGIIDGVVENKYEYQDALGFTMMAKRIMVDVNTEDNSNKTRVIKIVKVIDSLLVLWPKLVPTENIEGSYKLILNAIKDIENIK